jgi:hypothetical protein
MENMKPKNYLGPTFLANIIAVVLIFIYFLQTTGGISLGSIGAGIDSGGIIIFLFLLLIFGAILLIGGLASAKSITKGIKYRDWRLIVFGILPLIIYCLVLIKH